MRIGLFLDDTRRPGVVTWMDYPEGGVVWDVAKSHEEFLQYLESGKQYEVFSFDHDLCFEHMRALYENPIRHLLEDFATPTGVNYPDAKDVGACNSLNLCSSRLL